MKLNRLKYVTVIFRKYATFDSINFKSLNSTTQGVLNQILFQNFISISMSVYNHLQATVNRAFKTTF